MFVDRIINNVYCSRCYSDGEKARVRGSENETESVVRRFLGTVAVVTAEEQLMCRYEEKNGGDCVAGGAVS